MSDSTETLLTLSKKILELAKEQAEFVKGEYESYLTADLSLSKTIQSNELFRKVIRFTSDITDSFPDLYKAATGCKGVYVFRVKEQVSVNPFDFNLTPHGSPIRGANLKLQVFSKDACFYVGKCYSLLTRMHSHFGDSKSATGALRLSNDHRIFMKDNVIVYCFVFKKTFNNFYHVLAKVIEKELHEKLQPLIGNK